MIGEPNSIDIAAMLPAAAITACTSTGASRRSERMPNTPTPAPSAISGASGPSTSAEGDRRQRGEHDPRQFDRLRPGRRRP